LIGFFGGTFDPVHRGHLHAATVARDRLALAEVRLVLAADPAHRAPPGAGASERWCMLQLATSGLDRIVADDRELRRNAPSYTVETLEDIRRERGNDAPVVWLLGWDAFTQLDAWYQWQRLLELAHLAVFRRPGDSAPMSAVLDAVYHARHTGDPRRLQQFPAGAIFVIDAEMLDVSATRVRALIAAGRSAAHLLTPDVWTYITDKQLYRGNAY
jgi:nicotinate-nucleotide adenylyltransferase